MNFLIYLFFAENKKGTGICDFLMEVIGVMIK